MINSHRESLFVSVCLLFHDFAAGTCTFMPCCKSSSKLSEHNWIPPGSVKWCFLRSQHQGAIIFSQQAEDGRCHALLVDVGHLRHQAKINQAQAAIIQQHPAIFYTTHVTHGFGLWTGYPNGSPNEWFLNIKLHTQYSISIIQIYSVFLMVWWRVDWWSRIIPNSPQVDSTHN